MRRNQMQHFPPEIIAAKPKIDEKVYYRKDQFLTMSYKQKKSQTKPIVMLSTFCGAFDVPHRKKVDKTIPAIVDSYNQSMGGVDSSDQVMYSHVRSRESPNRGRKRSFLIYCLVC